MIYLVVVLPPVVVGIRLRKLVTRDQCHASKPFLSTLVYVLLFFVVSSVDLLVLSAGFSASCMSSYQETPQPKVLLLPKSPLARLMMVLL